MRLSSILVKSRGKSLTVCSGAMSESATTVLISHAGQKTDTQISKERGTDKSSQKRRESKSQ